MAGMTQRDAALALGMSVASVSRVENGRSSTRSKAHRAYVKWFKGGMPVDVENPRREEHCVGKKKPK
jgi:transcriptional regulator with XRE-family HTH domain